MCSSSQSAAQQRILIQRSKFHDFDFLRFVPTKPFTPEFGGFNTKLTRMQGQGLKPRTKAMYTPVIDMTPSDPTTMKNAMLEAKRLTKKAGQATALFTTHLQLYRVGLNVQWVYSELFGEDFILRLGGMHFLKLCWCCGGSDGWKWVGRANESCFGGVLKILTGKNFSQNTRALRIVVEQVLHQILCEGNTFDELMQELKVRTSTSRTARYWVENLILPVLLMLIFIRAE